MIISASRRTDIPAFYSDWFFNRIHEGSVLVPNPYNPKMVSRVELSPAVVDCIVFWTKNPQPMMPRLDELDHYNYYFQFTLNPYGPDIENNLPSLDERIDIFRELSDRIGKHRVVWRYDPILTSPRYDVEFHKEAFSRIARALDGYTETCMLGFIDHYNHIRNDVGALGIEPLTPEEISEIGGSFAEIIKNTTINLETCTVRVDMSQYGIPQGLCVDDRLVERLTGYPVSAKKDKNQRAICRCVESIDIGTYESCLNGCLYCYAIKGNYASALRTSKRHDASSPMLIGYPQQDDIVKERPMKSLRTDQQSLF